MASGIHAQVTLMRSMVPFQSLLAAEKSPVWFNSGINNRDITFSPDGNLILTTVVAPKNQFSVIAMSENIDGRWSALETAPFSGEFQDIEAAFHPNGNWVYFASKRPKPDRVEPTGICGESATYRADGENPSIWGIQ